MKFRLTICVLMALLSAGMNLSEAENLRVCSSEMEFVLDAKVGGPLKIMYFGPRLSETDYANIS